MNVCFDPNVCFRPPPQKLRRFEVGPVSPHLQSFAALVAQQGYCRLVGWRKVRLVAAFSQWLGRRHVPLKELNERHVTTFLSGRGKHTGDRCGNGKTLALLLHHLRRANLVATSPGSSSAGRSDLRTADFEKFLLGERSLVPCTAGRYVRIVRRFLSQCFPDGKIHLKRLRTPDVTDFIVHDAPTHAGSTSSSDGVGVADFSEISISKRTHLDELGCCCTRRAPAAS